MGVTTFEYVAVAAASFLSAIVGGMAGHGTGLLMPLILVPVIGAESTVPVIGVASIFFNASRLVAFREHFRADLAWRLIMVAVPACLVGAWGFTRLGGAGASIWLGAALVLLVPARRVLVRLHGHLSRRGVQVAGIGYGILDGATPGMGVVLISILMGTGLSGPAVVATDAGISILLGFAKTGLFEAAGRLSAAEWTMALLVGIMATPGAFVARWLVARLSARVHGDLLDGAVVLGGLVLLWRGLPGG
jgi:uncharacterized membrane protein YfcA